MGNGHELYYNTTPHWLDTVRAALLSSSPALLLVSMARSFSSVPSFSGAARHARQVVVLRELREGVMKQRIAPLGHVRKRRKRGRA